MDLTSADDLAERPHERLRRMLDRAGLSNREVAASLEVAPETVSRWRSGQQEMRGRDLRAVIALLATRGLVITEDWVRTGAAPATIRTVAGGGSNVLAEAMHATANAPRGAQLEPKDVPAPDPRKTPAVEAEGKKRAG